ncbi:MAG: hypothetical protein D6725_08945, partial [Planctomycetota bacterium]
ECATAGCRGSRQAGRRRPVATLRMLLAGSGVFQQTAAGIRVALHESGGGSVWARNPVFGGIA